MTQKKNVGREEKRKVKAEQISGELYSPQFEKIETETSNKRKEAEKRN